MKARTPADLNNAQMTILWAITPSRCLVHGFTKLVVSRRRIRVDEMPVARRQTPMSNRRVTSAVLVDALGVSWIIMRYARRAYRGSGKSERAGFEPAVRVYPVRRFSKPLVSATHPPLQ